MNNITPIGIYLRKLRILNNEKMHQMACKLNWSKAYISAIERGVRSIPQDLQRRLEAHYVINEVEYKRAVQASPNHFIYIEKMQIVKMIQREIESMPVNNEYGLGYKKALETIKNSIYSIY